MGAIRKPLVKECLICGYFKIGHHHHSIYSEKYTDEQLRQGVLSKHNCPVCGHKSVIVWLPDYKEIIHRARDIRMAPP